MSEQEDALTKVYDLMLWFFPQAGKFPRDYRFILGDRVQNHLLDVHEWLIKARYVKNKLDILRSVNIRIEQLRHLARLCKDLKLVNVKKYEYFVKELNIIGGYIGGWVKSVERR